MSVRGAINIVGLLAVCVFSPFRFVAGENVGAGCRKLFFDLDQAGAVVTQEFSFFNVSSGVVDERLCSAARVKDL